MDELTARQLLTARANGKLLTRNIEGLKIVLGRVYIKLDVEEGFRNEGIEFDVQRQLVPVLFSSPQRCSGCGIVGHTIRIALVNSYSSSRINTNKLSNTI